jgi:hypothetical protein
MKKQLRISNLTEFFQQVEKTPFGVLAHLETLVHDDVSISQQFVIQENRFILSGAKESENGMIVYYKFVK